MKWNHQSFHCTVYQIFFIIILSFFNYLERFLKMLKKSMIIHIYKNTKQINKEIAINCYLKIFLRNILNSL